MSVSEYLANGGTITQCEPQRIPRPLGAGVKSKARILPKLSSRFDGKVRRNHYQFTGAK